MTAIAQTPADWSASLPHRHHVAAAAGWGFAALSVAAMLAGGVLLADWLERQAGNRNALDDAMLIDLPPLPPPPAVTAITEAAPDAPRVDAPELPDPARTMPQAPEPPMTEAAAAALPPPDPLALAQMPDLPMDALAPPPPEPVIEPLAEAKPKHLPAPAPSAASRKSVAKSSSDGAGQTTVAAGQIKDLKASWGAAIRRKVERRKAYPPAAGSDKGTATVRLTVTQGGALAAASLVRSSGNPALDAAALQAVQSAGAFPAAPQGLTEASYAFTLPINFTR